jgi:esterase/lipase superfamily enzyme
LCGASFGALHSMNLFLKRPDLIDGVIAMSGVYDLTEYTDGYWDNQVYYNSPAHYIPNLEDEWYLNHIRKSKHIHILTGGGDYEDPSATAKFSEILKAKGIEHDASIWGKDWRAMLPLYLETKF